MNKPKILVVDDDAVNLDSLKDFFTLHGYDDNWDILTTSSSSTAKEMLKRYIDEFNPIDILLTDLVMEEKDSGKQLIRYANSLDPTIMTILFTANEQGVDRMSVFEYGTFEVIEKNALGVNVSEEIAIKTEKALYLKSRIKQVNNMRKFFDHKVVTLLENDPEKVRLQRKDITIAFWDIRGFSRLCETLKERPESISAFINDYNLAVAECIRDNNGILDKFIGDGVMAIFGFDQEEDMGSYSAVRCALGVKQSFKHLVEKYYKIWSRITAGDIEIDVGCGIHTGSSLVGFISNSLRDQFTAIGPHVNLASRIEGYSQKGEILISQTTRAFCDEKILCEPIDPISDIKNIQGRFIVYKVDGLIS